MYVLMTYKHCINNLGKYILPKSRPISCQHVHINTYYHVLSIKVLPFIFTIDIAFLFILHVYLVFLLPYLWTYLMR